MALSSYERYAKNVGHCVDFDKKNPFNAPDSLSQNSFFWGGDFLDFGAYWVRGLELGLRFDNIL